MNSNELKTKWSKSIGKALIGRKIVNVRYLTDEEIERQGWDRAAVVLELDNGQSIWPSMDDEGNGPGALSSTDQAAEAPVI